MVTKVRTIDFLPDIFKTNTNRQVLSATLDQLVQQPDFKRIQGYAGSKFGYGVGKNDKYLVEPTKVRTDYQLEPAVVFKKPESKHAYDLITYPGILDSLNLNNGSFKNDDLMFNNQFYSWDSFCDLDKLINYAQYYWLPNGPEPLNITNQVTNDNEIIGVTKTNSDFNFKIDTVPVTGVKPTLTLVRGGTYKFNIDTNYNGKFYIQTSPGITGVDPVRTNFSSREVFGVSDNGQSDGVVTFDVPLATAQDNYNLPFGLTVDVVTNLSFDTINGSLLSKLGNIDNVYDLNNKTLLFYGTTPGTFGKINNWYGEYYDQNNISLGALPTINVTQTDSTTNILTCNSTTGMTINQGINFSGPIFGGVSNGGTLVVSSTTAVSNILTTTLTTDLSVNQEIIFGSSFANIQANTVYYIQNILNSTDFQISDTPNGSVFSLLTTSTPVSAVLYGGMYYVKEIINSTEFKISKEPNGSVVALSSNTGLMTGILDQGQFDQTITTEINKHLYQITLVPAGNNDYVVRLFEKQLLPDNRKLVVKYGTQYIGRTFYKTSSSEIKLVPVLTAALDTFYYQDDSDPNNYGVIKIIDTTLSALINIDEEILGKKQYTSPNNIKFTNGLKVSFSGNIYPNEYTFGEYYVEGVGTSIRLLPVGEFEVPELFGSVLTNEFDSIPYDSEPYNDSLYYPTYPDYIVINRNSLSKNAWSRSNRWFHVDVLNTVINTLPVSPISTGALGNVENRAKRPIIEFYPNLKLFNAGSIGKQKVSFINFDVTDAFNEVAGQTNFIPDGASSYLYNNATIVFANDSNLEVRNKIYRVQFTETVDNQPYVITLSEVENGTVLDNEQILITQGENYFAKTFYFDGDNWYQGQQKEIVNQPPKFDIFDNNGISYSNTDFYPSSDFNGCTLFEYAPGIGINDPVLGFPIKYSSDTNFSDFLFDYTINSQTFNFVENTEIINQPISNGYVYNYSSLVDYTREIGWQTTVQESIQYQIFNSFYLKTLNQNGIICDVKVNSQTENLWPVIVVYVDNQRLNSSEFNYTTGSNSTIINFVNQPEENSQITIMLYSDQISKTAYYQIPFNLERNPFNEEISSIALGDIRGHFKSICNNSPTFSGLAFGPNNYRDIGNVVPYGTKIIQSGAPLTCAAPFLRTSDNNFYNSLTFNQNEYMNYKWLLIQTVTNNDYNLTQTPNYILDDVIEKIAGSRLDTNSFFWSDMVPSKNVFKTSRYVFKSNLDTSVFQLSQTYDFSSANYNGVLVYLTTTINGVNQTIQLVRDIDYNLSTVLPNLTITKDLKTGDVIIIKEYNQTYGSFVPNTPTKLGLYQSYVPKVIFDNTYINPSYFILGHDGSYNKLYGSYIDGILDDIRDIVLLEFELRIYNNIKVGSTLQLGYDDIVPGYFRNTGIDYKEYYKVYNVNFLNWVGQNRIDYKEHYYIATNPYTYNYTGSRYKMDNSPVIQGSWRGIYLYLYDTNNPDTAPWEMLGLNDKPSWWDSRYGNAPYTSDNLYMWQDIANGYIYNDGNPYINDKRIRNGLLDIIPVDSNGKLKDPFGFLFNYYDVDKFSQPWTTGETSPTEYSYLKSSSWPFDLIKLLSLYKPAKFFSLGIDLDDYKFSSEFNQYLYKGRHRNVLDELQIYGNGVAKNSYINWIVDYIKQFGVDGTLTVSTLLNNLDVRLAYRMAGFSDKDVLKLFVEKGTTNSKNNSLLIPDDSFDLILYDNQPINTLTYSSIIVQKTLNGFKVYGNSQNQNYFLTKAPLLNGLLETISIDNFKVKIPVNYADEILTIPYGYEFTSKDNLCTFIKGYGLYLNDQGFIFDNIENGVELSWNQMIHELVYWMKTGWETGSTININPSARTLKFNKEGYIVQPLTIQKDNFVLNQNSIPILLNDLFINRNQTELSIKALNQGDALSFFKGNVSNMEHVIILDNTTVFNDVIYNLSTGLRQQRIYVMGQKSAEWQGYVDAAGFILNQDNIKEWQQNQKYSKGTIVKYKNDYYIANEVIILPTNEFDFSKWEKTSNELIQKGLLPNPSTRAYEATLFYDTTNPNLENDNDLLGMSLIGFRPRQYLADANLTDATQVNVYKNMIPIKGTVDSITRLQGINLQENQLNYSVHENWAIKNSEYGGLLNQNFIEFTLNQALLTGNPSIVAIIQDTSVDNAQQQVPLYNLKNYGRPISNTNILPTLATPYVEKLASAGYVNLEDVILLGFYLDNLDDTSIINVYKNEYVWLASKDSDWQIYTPLSTKAPLKLVFNNLNGTVTLYFSKPHNLLKNQVIGIINFDERVNGFYLVDDIVSIEGVNVTLELDPQTKSIIGYGLVYLLQSQRVTTARDIDSLPLLNAEYSTNKVWVDEGTNGDWVVYEKTNNYSSQNLPQTGLTTTNFGSASAYIKDVGYFVSDSGQGKLYHYSKILQGLFYLKNTITVGGEYGTAITYAGDLIIVSKPDSSISQIFIYRIPPSGNINSIVLEQVISIIGGRVGDAMDISGDSNLLYLGAQNDETVLAFQRDKELSYSSAGMTLSSATVVNQAQFIVTGNKLSSVNEGQRINFVTNYTSISVNTLFNAVEGTYLFRVSGDQRSKLTNGDKVAFSNTGPTGSLLYTIANEAYDPGTNRTTFYTVEMIFATIPAGSPIYTVTFSDDATLTVVTGIYNSSNNTTTFYTLEKNDYTAATGSYVYFAKTNFSLVGAISPPIAVAGDKFGTSVATNYDGSKLFVGAPYTDYSPSILNTGVVYFYDRLIENIEVQYDQAPTNPLLIILAFQPTNQTRVYINGQLLSTSNYVVILNVIVIGTIGLLAGDIITVSSAQFVLTQQIIGFDNASDLRQGELFGLSLDCNIYGSELIVGAPFDVFNNVQTEGAVYRFTNEGKRFGIMTGLIATNLTASTYLLINGYRVTVTPGNAAHVANEINQAGVTNVFAYATEDARLVIRLRDINLGPTNNKLNLSVFNGNYLYELGFTDYIKSQTIQDLHSQTRTQFGYNVKFNENNSFVVSAPVANRYINTTFDFSNDSNIKNDTVFDNNLTNFEDVNSNFGAAYMYDYIQSYDESLTNIGKYIYSQPLNDIEQNYNGNANYGASIAFNDNTVIIAAPNYNLNSQYGRVLVWSNESEIVNWHQYRESSPVVDIQQIQKASLYKNTDDTTLTGLDYIDPLQGKLLGIVGENIDFVSSVDPAGYNGIGKTNSVIWTNLFIGKIWFNTTETRFMNYHQDDIVYNSRYWGTVFPGSNVTVYTWVESDVVPSLYQGPGTPYDIFKYSVVFVTDSNNNLVEKYYYWVRNTNTIVTKLGKTLSDTIIEQYIANPQTSGVAFMAPIKSNVYGFYNAQEYINDVSTNLHLGYGGNQSVGHLDFQLIRTNYPDDFLSGLPNYVKGYTTPSGLYDRMLDSFAGVDEAGAPVPDYTLPKLLQTGVGVRPRQSFFIKRTDAIKNYLTYANEIVKQYPINEFDSLTFLHAQGEYYNVSDYWEYIYWWANGYDNSTKTAFEVPIYTDLLTIDATEGLIVGVTTNSQNNREVYIYESNEWIRIGVENGTVQFLNKLWEYSTYNIGFGLGYDTNSYGFFPSTETKFIIRALNEQIYTGALFKYRNQSLTLLFEYIQSENLESQNYLPWLTKTSFADVGYTVRELTTNQKYQRDNQSLLEGYIQEIKPYHVVIKEFYLEYSKTDLYAGNITDYDLPAIYNENIGKFVSPQLLFGYESQGIYPSSPYEFTLDSDIWNLPQYSSWFNNYGTTFDITYNSEVCFLGQYVSTADLEIYVDNAEGLPVQGYIRLDNEIILYTEIDREHNLLSGITRGVDNTTISNHFAGISIFMNLPEVIVLESGRDYLHPPVVKAFVDLTKYPAPTKEAVLSAVLNDGKVTSVKVIDAGEGYAVIPELVFDFSKTFETELFRLNFVGSTAQYLTTDLNNGEIIYSTGVGSNGVTIIPDGYYYISTTQISTVGLFVEGTVLSFHRTYRDAILGINKVQFINQTLLSEDYVHKISITAKAIPNMGNNQVRTIKPILKFDRTSYRTKLTEWVPNNFYSSPYLSIGNDSSNTTKLYASTNSNALSGTGGSGSGATFVIYNVLLGGTYNASVSNAGTNYIVGDAIVISGTSLSGYNSSTSKNGTLINGTTLVGITNTSGISVGDYVTGNGIPYATKVLSISTNQNIMISEPVTYTGTSKLFFLTGNIPNDCLIVVTSIGMTGNITGVATYGTAIDASLASLQGATLPIQSISDDNGNVVVEIDYSYSDLQPGQINGSYMYFYRTHNFYTYDDTGVNFVASITGTTMTVTAIENGKVLSLNDFIYGNEVTSLTQITAFVSGSGGTGTYTVSQSQNISARQMNNSGGALIRISRPKFDPSSINNLYYMEIINSGFIYSVGDRIIIPGSLLGGSDGINDATIYVDYALGNGSIAIANITGISYGEFAQYYVQVIDYDDTTQTGNIKLYTNAQLTNSVPYASFIWDGTGDDYGYLPEPIQANYSYNYNLSSIVIYAGYVWQCIEANNDSEFDFNKWYLLQSDDPALNALDRIEAYYQPTINMVGKDPQQLLQGISYPNNTYYGNAFAPEDELPLDTIVQSLPFYPTGVNIKAITYNSTTMVAIGETSEQTILLVKEQTNLWSIHKISDINLNTTDLIYNSIDETYTLTTETTANPIYISFDGDVWISNGIITGFDETGYDTVDYDTSQINVPTIPLQAVTYHDGYYYSVGTKILRSQNQINWDIVYSFPSFRLENNLKDVIFVNNTTFVGFITVGYGYDVVSGGSTSNPVISLQSKILTSLDGVVWNMLTPNTSSNAFNSVASSTSLNRIVIVGDAGSVFYSTNTSNWVQGSIAGSPVSTNINSVVYGNSIFVAVGDKIGTGATDPGLILTSVNGITWTQVSSQYFTVENLNYVYFSNGIFYAVGNNNTILESSDGVLWNDISTLSAQDPYYVVQGNDFLFGYGPEELVAGVVTDSLAMYVNTAPGAYWDLTYSDPILYKYTGFNMSADILTPNLNLTVSFADLAVNPARLSVFKYNTVTKLSTRIYENVSTAGYTTSYSVDWISQTITLNEALPSGHSLIVEVYEVGNGTELIRNNSKYVPIQIDEITGFSKIVFDNSFKVLTNDPLVYASVNGGTLDKLEYNTDYVITNDSQNNMVLQFNGYTFDQSQDYIVFAILDDLSDLYGSPSYNYSIPETEVFVATTATVNFALNSNLTFLTGDNIDNSIVELNGERLIPYNIGGADYEFQNISGTWYLHLYVAVGTSQDDIVAITTYYDTSRQFLTTEKYYDISNGIQTTQISFVDNSVTPVQVSFVADPLFSSNDLVRFNGIYGSVELNSMTVYVDKLSSTAYALYLDSGLTLPVDRNMISNYVGNGSANLDSETIEVPYPATISPIPMTYTDATRTWVTINGLRLNPKEAAFSVRAIFVGSILGTTLNVSSISQGKLSIGQEIFGGNITAGTTIISYNTGFGGIGTYEVSISQTVTETNMNTEFDNRLSLFANTVTTDVILVTSMVTGASPNPMSFNVSVNKYGTGVVYRTNPSDGSWLIQDFNSTDTVMYFNNVSNLVETLIETVNVETDGSVIYAYVQCDINEVKEVSVYNETTITNLLSSQFGITLFNGKPAIIFSSGATNGQVVTVTLTIGNIVEINGERIRFDNIDSVNNTLSGLTRGVQGTSASEIHSIYSMGYGINPARRLTDLEYDIDWSSANITPNGDPLQISTTISAEFLQNDQINR